MKVELSEALEHVRSLTTLDVGELIRDAELRGEGAEIYHVVDPYDINLFCFPIQPADASSVDPVQIGRDQIGLYEVFYRSERRPILAPEYDKEIKAISSWTLSNSRAFYNKIEMVQELLAMAGYREEEFAELLEKHGAAHAMTARENLRLLLAAALGLHSHAIERFRELCAHRIERGFGSRSNSLVLSVLDRYDSIGRDEQRASSRYREIWKILRSVAFRAGANIRHARYDANILDKLFYLNAELEKAFCRKELDRRILFHYVSTAHRTREVFFSKKVQCHLPVVAGKPYCFWRNSNQMFAYAVRRAVLLGEKEDHNKTIGRLRSLARLVQEDFTGLGECGRCILHGGRPADCASVELCELIEELRLDVESELIRINDTFLGGKLRTYAQLNALSEADAGESERPLVRAIVELRDQPSMRDLLVQRALDSQSALEARGVLLTGMSQQARNFFGEFSGEALDSVTASSQFLPRYPRFDSSEYLDIWQGILRFFDELSVGEMRLEGMIPNDVDRKNLASAYRRFLEKEFRGVGVGSRAEHELLRILLYISFSIRKYNSKAFDLALRRSGEYPGGSVEFLYAAVWAGRRAGRFSEAAEVASEAIESFPEDPRLYHGLSLVISAWIQEESCDVACPRSLEDCKRYAKKAISLYEASGGADLEVLAANYNNLVFWSSLDRHDGFDLVGARHALRRLHEVQDKDEWLPHNPEYHHTEANLELEEARDAVLAGDCDAASKKLSCAYQDAQIAVENFARKPEHDRSLREIEEFAKEHSIKILRPR